MSVTTQAVSITYEPNVNCGHLSRHEAKDAAECAAHDITRFVGREIERACGAKLKSKPVEFERQRASIASFSPLSWQRFPQQIPTERPSLGVECLKRRPN